MAIIDNGLEAVVMRNKMESKDALAAKGSLYVGTGGRTTVTTSSNTTVSIPETIAFNPPNTNGGVMIRDTSADNTTGWKVDKIKAENLENGRVGQATRADQADTVLSNSEYKSFVDAFVQECLLKIYPVGSIYMSTSNVSPQTFLGGTWISWGAGRVPVGVNTTDADFETVEKTGGEKAHILTMGEMPSHSHNIFVKSREITGNPYYPTEQGVIMTNVASGTAISAPVPGLGSSYNGGVGQFGMTSVGGDASHNNLQPYITCYMWKRTA